MVKKTDGNTVETLESIAPSKKSVDRSIDPLLLQTDLQFAARDKKVKKFKSILETLALSHMEDTPQAIESALMELAPGLIHDKRPAQRMFSAAVDVLCDIVPRLPYNDKDINSPHSDDIKKTMILAERICSHAMSDRDGRKLAKTSEWLAEHFGPLNMKPNWFTLATGCS